MDEILPVVRCEKVCKTYSQGHTAVHALTDITLSIKRGEFVALCGPSGSGKTTLLNLIGGLDLPTSGSIRVNSIALENLNSSELSELRLNSIGFVFQSYNLIPVFSALENVEFVMQLQGVPNRERKERAKKILDRVGLGTMLHRRPAELSGGQQQRVAIARAIVSEPAIILADEPTANLDSKTAGALLDLMRDMNESENSTFIFSTHDALVMEHAKRLIRLVDGKVEIQQSSQHVA